MAGYRELLAVEWNDLAVETFCANFPAVPVYHGDINALSVEHIIQQTDVQVGKLDVLDGSPPCQGFSTAGKRFLEDERNQLFREYVRILHGLQPKAFVMENVSGIIKGSMKLIFSCILQALKAAGYAVSAYLLNTRYFHVPQTRERMIFIGLRNDLGIIPSYPKAQSYDISLREAFYCLSENTSENIIYPPWLKVGVKEMHRRETTGDKTKAKAFKKYKGSTGSARSFVRLCWDQPATTLCKTFIAVAGLGHPDDERFLNEAECKRISSFPDAFIFQGTLKEKIALMGNAVPPLFMRAIAQHVRSLLNI